MIRDEEHERVLRENRTLKAVCSFQQDAFVALKQKNEWDKPEVLRERYLEASEELRKEGQ